MKASQSTGKAESSGQSDDSSNLLGVLEKAGLKWQKTLVWDQVLGFSDLRGASSWCSMIQGVTFQWLNEVKIIGDKTKSGNLKGQVGCVVDNKILQEDGRSCSGKESYIRCPSVPWMKGRDQEGVRRQQQWGMWASKGSGSGDSRQTGRLASLQRELSLLEGPSVRAKGKLIKKCCVPLLSVSCPLPVTQTIFVDLVEERNNVDQKFLGFMRLMHYLLR